MDILGLGLLQINDWLLVFTAFFTVAYFYFTWQFDFFTKRGLSGPKPTPFVGTALGLFTEGIHGLDVKNRQIYGKLYGTFDGPRPVLICQDVEFMKHIFVKDHPDFINRRGFAGSSKVSSKMLSVAEGEHWKIMRSTMSPTFSTGKLKLMTKQINECAEALVEALAKEADNGNCIECKEFAGAFTMDVIALTAFGLKVDSQKNKNSEFINMAKKSFNISVFSPFILISFFLPFLIKVVNALEIDFFPKDVTKFFLDVTNQTIDAREESDQKRLDFIQLMLKSHREKNDGDTEHDREFNELHGGVVKRGLTRDEILAQSVLFFIAGYETTATSISFGMYLMAMNPDIQEKLFEEITSVAGDKEIDYNLLCEMNLLEMCCQETLRIYPPAVRVNRECTRSTTVRGIDIPKGLAIEFPVYAIHHDPEIWPEPEKFNPYRFTQEEKAKHGQYDWIPFGSGPRNCIAMRLALTEFKIAMAYIVRNYKLIRGPKTEVPLKLKKAGLMQAENGLWINIEKR